MGLRLRISLAVTSVFIALAAAIYLLFSSVLLKEFGKLEEDRAAINSSRIRDSILGIQEELATRSNDWGYWDDTYYFIEGKNQKYIESNLSYESLSPFDLTYALYLKRDGSIVYGTAVSSADQKVNQIPSEVAAELLRTPPVHSFIQKTPSEAKHGIITIRGEPLFFAISTVRDSKQEREPNGFILFTQGLTESVKKKIYRRVQLSVSFSTGPFSGHAASVIAANSFPNSKWPVFEHLEFSSHVYDLMSDALSQPAILYSIEIDREILRQGIAARNYLFSLLAIFVVFTNVAVLALLDRAVIGRLKIFVARIADITSRNDPSLRIDVKGSDELGRMAVSFNHLLSVIDQTYKDLTMAREIAESANQAKSDFIAKVSHELRTPIHSIMGLLRVVRKKVADPPTRTQIGMIRDAALGLLGVVNDILDFSKRVAEGVTISEAEMNLRDVIRGAIRTVAPRIFEKEGLECFGSVDNSIPVIVLGDSKRLGQVLVNLLSNSVKFTDYGHIRLDVKLATTIASAQMIEFSVEDTGIGIQSDKLSQIFDPFTQADNSAQRQYQGTGLGLTIARQLVEAMGGEIRVESLVNRGTKFSFQIPLKPIAGSPFVDCNAAYEKRVAIINNADSESAALAQTFEALRCAVTLFNSSSFSSTDINLGDFKQFDFIVVSGNAIAGNLTQKIIEFASKHNRRESLLATLSPFELTHREFLHKFGINRVLVSPFLLQDVPAALIGAYKEDFSAYDDFIELEKYSATGLRILAADDIAANQVVIKCLLEDAGHEVDVVSNGKELLEAVGHLIGMRDRRDDDRDYDLVLTDVQMPIMDGLTATRNIRQIEELRGFDLGHRLPVIAVTAHAMAEQQQEILSCGVDGFITKPIDPEELEAAMQRVLVSHGKFGQS